MNRRLARIPQFTHVAAVLLLLALFPKVFHGQTLQITSPADGAVVNSGQTLTVTVNADPSAVSDVTIIGQTTLGITPLVTAPPYQFSIYIPADITAGKYTLTALGIPLSGTGPILNTVTIDIERSDNPTQISSDPASIPFGYAGATCYLFITGAFADGSQVAVTESTQITYSSDTPAVATVDGRGAVTAVAPGSANIVVTYAGVSTQVPVSVAQAVILIPSPASLYISQAQRFAAQVNMASGVDQSVTWSMSPQLGTIDQTGLYTAPLSLSAWQAVTVTATSVGDPTKSASATVYVFPPVSITIAPSAAAVSAGQRSDFIATVTNGSTDVTWSVVPNGVGTVQPFDAPNVNNPYVPFTALKYYAPGIISSPQTVTVTATSVWDNSKTAPAQITLVPSVAVSVSPANATVYAFQTLQFAATVNYSSNQTVSWTLNPNVGTISATGLYTAPASIAAQQAVTVTATGPDIGAGTNWVPPALSYNTWTHLAMAYDGATLGLFVNGVQVNSQPLSGPASRAQFRLCLHQLVGQRRQFF